MGYIGMCRCEGNDIQPIYSGSRVYKSESLGLE